MLLSASLGAVLATGRPALYQPAADDEGRSAVPAELLLSDRMSFGRTLITLTAPERVIDPQLRSVLRDAMKLSFKRQYYL